jgi:hypothetical protein
MPPSSKRRRSGRRWKHVRRRKGLPQPLQRRLRCELRQHRHDPRILQLLQQIVPSLSVSFAFFVVHPLQPLTQVHRPPSQSMFVFPLQRNTSLLLRFFSQLHRSRCPCTRESSMSVRLLVLIGFLAGSIQHASKTIAHFDYFSQLHAMLLRLRCRRLLLLRFSF